MFFGFGWISAVNLLRLLPMSETFVPLRPPFRDLRGEIQNLVDSPIASVAVITSTPGAVRANHYHKTDDHYCWIQSGALYYYHRPTGSTEAPEEFRITAGQLFYTPPQYDHAMLFTEPSTMFVFAKNDRHMANYEADTVRIPSIIPEARMKEFSS